MKRTLNISLVLTTYNESQSIGVFTSSLKDLREFPKEIVLVDSCSNDGTADIFLKNLSDVSHLINILVISEKCNISRGRNIAIENASSKLIAITDAGVVIDENWLSEIYKSLLGSDVVAGYFRFGGGNKIQLAYKELFYQPDFKINKSEFNPSSRSLGIRKDVWKNVGGYDEKLDIGEDTEFDIRIREKGYIISCNFNAIVEWKVRSTLKELFEQHRKYSYWDMRIGQNRLGNLFFIGYGILNISLIFLSILNPYFIFPLLAAIIFPVVRKKKIPTIINLLVSVTCYLGKGLGAIGGLIKYYTK